MIAGGARWIWFRDRDLEPGARQALATSLLAIARETGARLTVGADARLAAAIGADGLHLPGSATARDVEAARRVLPAGAHVGISAHGPAEVAAAAETGADYATLSPIHATPSKPGYGPALGPEAIRAAAAHGIPVVALGGIGVGEARPCIAAGADGIAVMGALMRAADPAGEARRLLDALGAI